VLGVRDGAPAVVALAVPAGVQGAVRVTVFDDHLAPLAERLIYRNRGADLKITMVADKATYHPRDAVKLAIETRGPDGAPVAADLAISAVDDTVLTFADDKQATLLARMYLEAELPGQKIEEPNFYFSDDKQGAGRARSRARHAGLAAVRLEAGVAAPPEPPIEGPWTFTGELGPRPARRATPLRRQGADGHGKPRAGKGGDEDRDEDGIEDADDEDDRQVKAFARKAPADRGERRGEALARKAPADRGERRGEALARKAPEEPAEQPVEKAVPPRQACHGRRSPCAPRGESRGRGSAGHATG